MCAGAFGTRTNVPIVNQPKRKEGIMNKEGAHWEPPAPPAKEEGEAEGVDPIVQFVSLPAHCAVMGGAPLTTFIQVLRRLHCTMVETQDMVQFFVDRELRSLRENQDSLDERIRQIRDSLEESMGLVAVAHLHGHA